MKFNDVAPEHLGGGVVIFRRALDWDCKTVINWIEHELQAEQSQMYTKAINPETGKESFLNRSGYYFDLDTVEQMPRRASQIHTTTDGEFKGFLDFLEDSRDKYLLKYLTLFPMAYKNIWWKVKGHIVSYKRGVYLGAHSDTSADYVYGLPEPGDQLATRNTTTVLMYFNDCVDTDDQVTSTSFCGGHHYFNYLDIEIQPKRGDVLMFPSNYMATHEVKPVSSGVRYSYLGWYSHGTPNTAVNESVTDPNKDPDVAKTATNVYMPTLRNDFVRLVKNSGITLSIPGFSFEEYNAD